MIDHSGLIISPPSGEYHLNSHITDNITSKYFNSSCFIPNILTGSLPLRSIVL